MRPSTTSIPILFLSGLTLANTPAEVESNDIVNAPNPTLANDNPFAFATPLPLSTKQKQQQQQQEQGQEQGTQRHHTVDLELRQAVAPAGGVPSTLAPTQMSPTTTYLIHGVNGQQTPVAYTQTFVKVPDQWPGPTAGSIGLGTIQGTVGVVHTKRAALPEPTAAGVGGGIWPRLERWRSGSESKINKRKKKPYTGSTNNNNAAAGPVQVPMFGLLAAAVLGGGVVAGALGVLL